MDDYMDEAAAEMVSVLEWLKRQLSKVRTGRATPKLLDPVQVTVPAYGSSMPINQLAKVQAPDARLIVVTPWDKSTIGDIERGIIAAGLGLNPSNDGQVIRVPVPPLTSERRRDLARQLRKTGEEAKVKMRHVRREYNELFKQGEKDGDISEDDLHRLLAKIQDLTNLEIKQVDAAMDAKEEEVMAI